MEKLTKPVNPVYKKSKQYTVKVPNEPTHQRVKNSISEREENKRKRKKERNDRNKGPKTTTTAGAI